MCINIANISNVKHTIKIRHKTYNYMLKQINIYINILKHTLESIYKTYLNFCNVIFMEVKKNMYICKKLKPCGVKVTA